MYKLFPELYSNIKDLLATVYSFAYIFFTIGIYLSLKRYYFKNVFHIVETRVYHSWTYN